MLLTKYGLPDFGVSSVAAASWPAGESGRFSPRPSTTTSFSGSAAIETGDFVLWLYGRWVNERLEKVLNRGRARRDVRNRVERFQPVSLWLLLLRLSCRDAKQNTSGCGCFHD